MSAGSILKKCCGGMLFSAALLCPCPTSIAHAAETQTHRKTKKPPLQPLPSGPTGPVQQIPLDSIAAVPPQVSYQNSLLTIVAPNSTLADILRAVRKQTGADIEVPTAPERVVTRLGPGPARDVLADLLNGSRFNYVLLGSPGNESVLTRVVLVPKATTPENPNPATPPAEGQPAVAETGTPPTPEADAAENNDAEAADDSANNGDDNADQAADGEQPAANPDQPAVKTPQQMLQEMQQRQLQLQQQQQNPGQAPGPPGSGMPPRPPQPQQPQ